MYYYKLFCLRVNTVLRISPTILRQRSLWCTITAAPDVASKLFYYRRFNRIFKKIFVPAEFLVEKSPLKGGLGENFMLALFRALC